MKSTAVVVGIALALFGSNWSLAGADAPRTLAAQIARLPWKTEETTVHLSPQKDSRITLVASYNKAGVVEDKDKGYVSFFPLRVTYDKSGSPVFSMEGDEMTDACRDGLHGWCNGSGNFENVTADGFDYALDLDWQIDGHKAASFKKTFHCKWVEQQQFEQDGFKIAIKVTTMQGA